MASFQRNGRLATGHWNFRLHFNINGGAAFGCAYADSIVFKDFFKDNPDSANAKFQTRTGIYEEGAGLDKVNLSWGHDEYIYHVTKDYLPDEALYMLRYHSFYPWHKEGEYTHLTNETDRANLKWVRAFNRYDLYSKGAPRPKVDELMPYYKDLVDEFLPEPLKW